MTAAIDPVPACSVDARVVRCSDVCREHVLIEVVVPDFPPSQPGQFLQILCRSVDVPEPAVLDWPADGFPSLGAAAAAGREAYLRRPFSIADRWTASDGGEHVCVISRAVGPGTRWLEGLKPDSVLNITGPLGRGFVIPDGQRPLVLIGGGVGIPPLLYLARRLDELGRRDVTAVLGVMTRDLLPLQVRSAPASDGTPTPCVEFPAAVRVPTAVTSDDGSIGLRGVVTDALWVWDERRGTVGERPLVFACGPEAMLKAVARVTRELVMACQLCIERSMGCGVGTCLSCVVRARDEAHPEAWRWKLTCQDGPVFERDELLDYEGEPGA